MTNKSEQHVSGEGKQDFTIDHFWSQRITVDRVELTGNTRGWNLIDNTVETFLEAPLNLSEEFASEMPPEDSPLLFVSAPGAVGKTTLAKEIACRTGAIYIDLAQSEPVGGHTLSGGLVRTGVYERWQEETTTVLVDGLDEARLRVTQEAFEAFLSDVLDLSVARKLPIVLFGRSGSVLDAWFIVAERGAEVPVLEIGYFEVEDAIEFAVAKLRVDHPKRSHPQTDRRAIVLLLERIRNQTESDGDRFAGYAPVLQAVAEQVSREENTGALVAAIEKGVQSITLHDVASSILERERTKLESLNFEDPDLSRRLYLQDEQMAHLASRIYGNPPPEFPPMNPVDAKTYENALNTWVVDHPFLDGQDRPSSAVFDAVIATWTLRKSRSAQAKAAAIERELARGLAANPFLSEIYTNEILRSGDSYLPSEHVGIVYSSLRARLSLGDTAGMLIEAVEDAQDDEDLKADVEISQLRRNAERVRVLELYTERDGMIRLGGHMEDLEIVAEEACVEIGCGMEAILVAPISVQCGLLSLEANKIFIEPSGVGPISSVVLEATEYSGHAMTSVPVVRGKATLGASWPGVRSHPWTNFAIEKTPVDDPKVEEALRRLRKFVISFRSHSRGSLARYQGKIEHRRMTKGTGQYVLRLMVAKEILELNNSMYFLDSNRLADLTGLTYMDCMNWRFGRQAMEFVRMAL